MRKLPTRSLLVLTLMLTVANQAQANDPIALPRVTRALAASYYCPAPLSTNAVTVISYHVTNVCPAPLRINADSLGLVNSPSSLGLPVPQPKKEEDPSLTPEFIRALGVESAEGSYFVPNPLYATCSSANPNRTRHRRFAWHRRAGIELLPGEGFMRRLFFFPGWQTFPDIDNPPRTIAPDKKKLVIYAGEYGFVVCKPEKRWEAVRPGQPIIWEEPFVPCIPSGNSALIPFRHSVGAAAVEAAAQTYAATQNAAEEAPGLFAELEMPPVAAIGEDLPITYVIGVRGMEPGGHSKAVWLEQKSVVPANAVLTLKEGEGDSAPEIARFDGENLRALLDTMPLRQPVMLNTGEFLAYHRTLPASGIPKLKKKHTYTIELTMTANCAAYVPQKGDPYDFRDDKPPVAPPPLEKLTRKTLTAKYVFKTK